MAFILGKKLNMTQVWKKDRVIPVTVIKAEPNKVSLLRKKEKDGYEAVQVQLGKKKREFRTEGTELSARGGSLPAGQAGAFGGKAGDMVNVEAFKEGDLVRITGYSKGRGFQGVVKRHGFGGGPKTHGQKNRFRAPGSIGSTAFQRVVPGRKMAGRMGNDRVTVKNVEVVQVESEKHLLMLKGAVPGARGGLVQIQKVGSKK